MTPQGTWRRVSVTALRWLPEFGGMHVTSEVVKRHCGCEGQIGMRIDKGEVTFGVTPCDSHQAHAERAMDTLQNMPPQEREIGDLFQEQLDAEIGHA